MSNSADKRSVSTDALETLGTIIGDGEARDAIHLAVEPVYAGQRLLPGQDVGLVDGTAFAAKNCPKPLGIVDPFIVGQVEEGQRFWLVVYPRQIKSLRHVWEHPDFHESVGALPKPALGKVGRKTKSASPSPSPPQISSEEWIAQYAIQIGCRVDEIMNAADNYQSHGEYWVQGGRWEGQSLHPDFWKHWENVTGKTATDHYSFFSCSC